MIILKSRGHMIFRFSIGIRLQPYITQYDFLEFELSLGTILKLGFLIKYGTFLTISDHYFEKWICPVRGFVGILHIKIDPSDRETHCNTSYHKIGMSSPPIGPLKGALGPLGGPWNVNLSSLKVCWHVIYQNHSQW